MDDIFYDFVIYNGFERKLNGYFAVLMIKDGSILILMAPMLPEFAIKLSKKL